MKTWIALLRGINVGGNNILPMKELRALLQSEGHADVKTYIQSGNCIFNSRETDSQALADGIAAQVQKLFGFKPTVLTVPKAELRNAIENNPFAKYADEPKTVHFFFLKSPALAADLAALKAIQKESEHFKLTEKVFYLYAPEGIGRSKLASQIEKKLGVPTTARNLRTVLKLAELVKAS